MLELLSAAGAAAAGVLPHARALCDAALAAPTQQQVGGDSKSVAGATGFGPGASGAIPSTASPPDDGGVGDAMVEWVRSGGTSSSDNNNNNNADSTAAAAAAAGTRIAIVPARFPETGRGGAASIDIPAGEDAVCIPQSMLWTAQVAMEAPGPRGDAYRMFAALGEDTIAALWLVAEKAMGPASPWAPLIASLPLGNGNATGDGGCVGGLKVGGGGGGLQIMARGKVPGSCQVAQGPSLARLGKAGQTWEKPRLIQKQKKRRRF